MAQARPKLESGVTPRGVFRYPRLSTPDTKFNPEGLYKVDLILSADQAQPLIEKVDTAMAKSFEEAKRDPQNRGKKIKMADAPYKAVTNDAGEETGEVKFSFKMKASGKRKDGSPWTAKPSLFDSKGKPIARVNVGGGTEGKVSYEIMPFYTALVGAGVSLRLKAVQILKLVEFGDRDAKGYGFGEEEDGYEQDGNVETPDRSDEEEAATGADDERDF